MAFVTKRRWNNKRWSTEVDQYGSRHSLWGVPATVAIHEESRGKIQQQRDIDADPDAAALVGAGGVGRSYDLAGGNKLFWREVTRQAPHGDLRAGAAIGGIGDTAGQEHPLAPFETEPGELDHLAEGGARVSAMRLASVPADPIWRHRLTLPAGCRLPYQPALTRREIDEGSIRPAAVVNSYAVKDATGCKIAHILRPCAIPANRDLERRIWGTISITGGVSTVSFDRAALADLGPGALLFGLDTFGYTSVGASTWYPSTGRQYDWSGYASPADGDATAVYIYGWLSPANTITAGISADDGDGGGKAGTLLRDSAATNLTNTHQWYQIPLDSSLSITNGTTYHPISNCSATMGSAYDNAGGSAWYEFRAYTAGSLADFASWTSPSLQNPSAYIEHTPSGGGGAPWHYYRQLN